MLFRWQPHGLRLCFVTLCIGVVWIASSSSEHEGVHPSLRRVACTAMCVSNRPVMSARASLEGADQRLSMAKVRPGVSLGRPTAPRVMPEHRGSACGAVSSLNSWGCLRHLVCAALRGMLCGKCQSSSGW